MIIAHRWAVSAGITALVAASSLLAVRVVPAPRPEAATVSKSALPPSPVPSPSAPRRTASPTASSARPTPSFRAIRIAATAAGNQLFGVEPIACPTCVSGSRVQYVGQGHGIVVPLHDIPVAGRRTLIIYYESDGARPLQVVVADHPAVTLHLPGKDSWITPAQARLSIQIPAGDSKIRLFHADKPAPDLDEIVIR